MFSDPNVLFKDYIYLILFVLFLQLARDVLEQRYINYSSRVLDQEIQAKIKLRMFNQAINLDLAFYEDPDFYDQFQRASANINVLISKVLNNASQILSFSTTMIATFSVIWSSDPVVIVFAICPYIALKFFTTCNKLSYEQTKELVLPTRRKEYIKRQIFSKDAAKDLRSSELFSIFKEKFLQSTEDSVNIFNKYGFRIGILNTLASFFYVLLPLVGSIVYATFKIVVSKTLSLSNFTVLTSAVVSFNTRLSKLMQAFQNAHKLSLQIQDLRTFLSKPNEIKSGQRICDKIKTIEFNHVTFSYPNKKTVLHDLSLKMQKGKLVAIVGLNGAGKTTIIKLLLRLYDPDSGEILVNGINIKEYDLKQYRDQFAVALQDFKLFSLSIDENVLESEASQEEDAKIVDLCLKEVGLWQDIEKLPYKEKTQLSRLFYTDGVELSGGQAQKLLVARILKKYVTGISSVFILDEPTAALDPKSEYEMFQQLLEIGQTKILILITHRLSSTVHSNYIYLIKDGTVIEEGEHKTLMSEKGVYFNLFVKQAESYNNKGVIRC